jgi:hypothetical protein
VRRDACGMRREAARGAALPPSWLLLTVGGGWGRKRRIAIFCDKLTNLGWLTLSVLKYLMKTKKFICDSVEKMRLHFFSSISELAFLQEI